MKEKPPTFKIWKKWLFWNRTFWLTDVGNVQAMEFHPLWWTPVSLWVLWPFWTMCYLPIGPGSRWHRCQLGMFGLGYVTHSWPGRWCSLSSCNFPSMQTRSQMPGGSSDRSTWEILISQGGVHAFSSAKSVHTILLAHVGEATDESRHPPSHCSGDVFFPCMAQEARSFLCPSRPSEVRTQGHQRGSACSGLGVAPATPGFWLEPNVTGVSGLRACPFLGTANMARPLGVTGGRSGVGIPETSIHSACCSPAQYWLSGSRATELIILGPNRMEAVNSPIGWGGEKPVGYVKRGNSGILFAGAPPESLNRSKMGVHWVGLRCQVNSKAANKHSLPHVSNHS